MVAPWQKGKDEFNLLRHRNADNTKNDEYNCGGHALETFNIYLPYETKEEGAEIRYYCDIQKYAMPLAHAARKIRKDFPELHIVKEEAIRAKAFNGKDFLVIAFRYARDDFHFWKLEPENIWSNKWGRSDIIDFQPYKAVFDVWETDYTDYDSDIIFFVKRRKRQITTVFFYYIFTLYV